MFKPFQLTQTSDIVTLILSFHDVKSFAFSEKASNFV